MDIADIMLRLAKATPEKQAEVKLAILATMDSLLPREVGPQDPQVAAFTRDITDSPVFKGMNWDILG